MQNVQNVWEKDKILQKYKNHLLLLHSPIKPLDVIFLLINLLHCTEDHKWEKLHFFPRINALVYHHDDDYHHYNANDDYHDDEANE